MAEAIGPSRHVIINRARARVGLGRRDLDFVGRPDRAGVGIGPVGGRGAAGLPRIAAHRGPCSEPSRWRRTPTAASPGVRWGAPSGGMTSGVVARSGVFVWIARSLAGGR